MSQPPMEPATVTGGANMHLAGITTLSNLLSELPLPSATPDGGGGQALYNSDNSVHNHMFGFVQQCVQLGNAPFAAPLMAALSKTDTSGIAVKEAYSRIPKTVDGVHLPEIGRAILAQNPHVFAFHELSPVAAAPVTPSRVSAPSAPGSQASQQTASPAQAQNATQNVIPQQDAFSNGMEARQSVSAAGSAGGSSEPHTPATPGSASMAGEQIINVPGRDQTQLRKQIVSVGKQPKAQSRKKKDMVSELFDSLTPAAEYFSTGSRRKRVAPKTYTEDEYVKISLQEVAASREAQTLELMLAGATPMFPGRKRRREEDEEIDELDRPLTPTDVIREREREWHEVMKKRKEKYKRRKDERAYWDTEELLENESYKSFIQSVDQIFEDCEELDFAAGEDEDEIPQECLIAKRTLAELRTTAHKLKRMNATCRLPIDRLVKLLTILEKNIRDVTQQESLVPFFEERDDDEMDVQFRELVDARILRAADASLTALTIMTADRMPKQVYIEDAIERSIQLAKQMCTNVIFPAYDLTYRTSQEKGTDMKPKKEPTKSRGRKSTAKEERQNSRSKTVQRVYKRMSELMSCFAELVQLQPLTETAVLQLATLAVSPFFVESVSDMQLNSLKLATAIFARYEKYRQIILQDVLGSLYRLPTNKSSQKTYRLNSEEYVQMITVLIMQLVQASAKVPSTKSRSRVVDGDDEEEGYNSHGWGQQPTAQPQEADVVVLNSYEDGKGYAMQFLQAFLAKCTSKSEDDYRKLFEAFLHDLLAAVHKAEWPAAELLLTLLGGLLVNTFRNSKLEMSLRVASLEYLGTATARLRKDDVESQVDEAKLDQIVLQLTQDEDDFDQSTSSNRPIKIEDISEDKMQILKRAVIDYLLQQGESDFEYARLFYIAQWYKDATAEFEKVKGGNGKTGHSDVGGRTAAEHEQYKWAMQQSAATKQFLLTLVDREEEIHSAGGIGENRGCLSEEQAIFVVKYLASKRTLSQSFDIYLGHIMNGILHENAVGIRTKAMRCLTQVIEVDPDVLSRTDVQRTVKARLVDNSSNVREATIDLIGKYILTRPDLIEKYFDMIGERIRDTAVSVRKRVIRILRDVCEKRPDFERVPEICAKIIRRVNDEESIKKLVNETFSHLWFGSVKEKDTASSLKKVWVITDTISLLRDNGLDSVESLLSSLVKSGDRNTMNASQRIVNILVDSVIGIDAENKRKELLACLTALYLFSKVCPELMVKHAETMQPYLSMSTTGASEQQVLVQVINILERVVPLIDHPSETFLSSLEESFLKLTKGGSIMVVNASISCLASIIEKQKRSYSQVYQLFLYYHNVIKSCREQLKKTGSFLPSHSRSLSRAIHSVGLMSRYFDFQQQQQQEGQTWAEKVFDGHFCAQHSEFLIHEDLKKHYILLLRTTEPQYLELKIQTLRNIELFLQAEEHKMIKSDEEWQKAKEREDLKEMGDASSGMGSTVIQNYWGNTMNCYVNPDLRVRLAATSVITQTLQQGLVTPAPSIACLIAMTTDPEQQIRVKAEIMLKEIEQKYHGFVPTKAVLGVKCAFKLQQLIQQHNTQERHTVVRGLPPNPAPDSVALLAQLYSILRSNRQPRRSFIQNLLRMFDESSKISLEELIFVADNLATFPYQIVEEPLYVIHQADAIISVSGPNVVQTFKEQLYPRFDANGKPLISGDDDDDETMEQIYMRLPRELNSLHECLNASQGCYLLLYLKSYLKELYTITDSKLQEYAPSEPQKPYEKSLTRRPNVPIFQPLSALEELDPAVTALRDTPDGRYRLVNQFVNFRAMMMNFDNSTGSEDGNPVTEQTNSRQSTPAPVADPEQSME